MFSKRIILLLFIVLVTASEEEEANSKSQEKDSTSQEKDSKAEEVSEGKNASGIDCSTVPDLNCSEAPPPYCHRCDGSGDALMRCSHCHGMCENQAHKMCKQCFGSDMFITYCCCQDWNCDCGNDDDDSQAEDGAGEDNDEDNEQENEEGDEKKVNALAAEQDVQDTVAET